LQNGRTTRRWWPISRNHCLALEAGTGSPDSESAAGQTRNDLASMSGAVFMSALDNPH